VKRIKDIENHLERADAMYDRFIKIEAVEEKRKARERILKIGVGIASILCALYAVYLQF
jgi:hypothetical protein